MHWVPTGQSVNKKYNVGVLREFRKRFRRKRPALFKSGQWHFHQDNAPEAVTKVIDTLTQEDFHGAWQKLLERYKCIAAEGNYFEGD